MSFYSYAIIDPRPVSREASLADLAAIPSMGLEVTVPELAEVCSLGNVDPQHLGGDATTAAIEEVLSTRFQLPPVGARLVTLRADADSVGAMALIEILRQQAEETPWPEHHGDRLWAVAERIDIIAAADKGHSEWSPAVGFIPATVFDGLKAEVMNFRLPLEERVALTRSWLETGDFPGSAAAIAAVDRERSETVGLVEEVKTTLTGRVAVVESTSRFAVSAAYSKADVVVAVNPAFRFGGGEPHRKVTVCQKRPGLVDLKAVFADFNEIEPGWGGSPTIGGSPQGVSSVIATEEVVKVVEQHLL